MHRLLRRQGWQTGRGQTGRLMRSLGLRASSVASVRSPRSLIRRAGAGRISTSDTSVPTYRAGSGL
jgi:hypothetical protein